jgi:hypothetical protein
MEKLRCGECQAFEVYRPTLAECSVEMARHRERDGCGQKVTK